MQSQTDIRQGITDKIVESLKAGRIPWRKPWRSGPRTPTNFVTKRRYNGINIPILWAASQERRYDVDYFATFQQWKSVGASVKKGEKAINVVFYKPLKKVVRDDNGKERLETFPLLKTFPVFSIHQVAGEVVETFFKRPTGPSLFGDDQAEFHRVVAATKADIRYGGSLAAYHRLPADFIQMPPQHSFDSFAAYAETLAHELAHWSEHRLEWTGNYAEGELRAELSAIFTVAALDIPESNDLKNHAAYIGSWLEALENDPKFIFRASAAASKATDFILSFSETSGKSIVEEEPDAVAA